MALSAFPHLRAKEARWDETVQVWQLVLDGINYQLAQRALVEVLKTARFFPTPAEVRLQSIELRQCERAEQQHLEAAAALTVGESQDKEAVDRARGEFMRRLRAKTNESGG